MLRQIDLADPTLIPLEREALFKMLEKRERYVEQGRSREAHGAGTMILILWKTLTGDFQDTVPTDCAGL